MIKGPLRTIVSSGYDHRAGSYDILECGHRFDASGQVTKKKPRQRHCYSCVVSRDFLDEAFALRAELKKTMTYVISGLSLERISGLRRAIAGLNQECERAEAEAREKKKD